MTEMVPFESLTLLLTRIQETLLPSTSLATLEAMWKEIDSTNVSTSPNLKQNKERVLCSHLIKGKSGKTCSTTSIKGTTLCKRHTIINIPTAKEALILPFNYVWISDLDTNDINVRVAALTGWPHPYLPKSPPGPIPTISKVEVEEELSPFLLASYRKKGYTKTTRPKSPPFPPPNRM